MATVQTYIAPVLVKYTKLFT